jgi:hypothetical protein
MTVAMPVSAATLPIGSSLAAVDAGAVGVGAAVGGAGVGAGWAWASRVKAGLASSIVSGVISTPAGAGIAETSAAPSMMTPTSASANEIRENLTIEPSPGMATAVWQPGSIKAMRG